MGDSHMEIDGTQIDDLERDEDVPDASEQLDQLQSDDTLVDRGVDDVLDEGLITADHWSQAERFGMTAAEQRQGPSLDDWLKQEEPEVAAGDDGPDEDDDEDDLVHEVGRSRSGRLTAVASSGDDDPASDIYGIDVGIDGGAASAEEAAMHVIEDQDDLVD